MIESQLPAGSRVGQYEIRKFIARGGMAEVYLAFDAELERPVALKIMLPALAADTQYVERFRREARTVARLDHPNIVQVFSVGLTPETKRPYIAMQYIEGGSLDDILAQLANRGKLLPTDQALLIIRQIAEALAVAHNAGVIHRDLKPSNVLIRPDGAPMLVDLGIAAVSDKTRLTQTGGLIGTPHYMSPEQVRGQELDGRSDLYALGVMLYEMLAGRLPFAEEDPIAVLHQQVYEMPIPLEKRRPDLSPQVLALVATCLQKEPERRFQRAEAVVQAIDVALQVAGSDVTIAQTTEILTHLRDSALISRQQVVRVPTGERPRRPVPLWAIVTFVVLAAAIGALFLFRPENQEQPLAATTASPEPADTAVPAAPTVTPEQIIVIATDTAVPTPIPTLLPTSTTTPTATAASTTDAASALSAGTATTTPTTSAAEFIITATQSQNQTGLQIAPGQTVLIEYVSGSWRAGPSPTWPLVGPDGDSQVASKATFPVPDAPVVSLIAGIGNAPPRFVGQRLQFQSETGGLLWLGANDDGFSDNQGSLTVRITIESVTQYQPVPLGAQANASIDFAAPPTGSVSLGGLPFELSPRIFKSQAAATSFEDAPTRLLLFVDVPQPQRVHLLLNTGNGYLTFANQTIGQVIAYCDETPQLITELKLSRDLREWHNAENVVSTAVQSHPVWSEPITEDVTGTIDLLSLDLPDACRYGRLTAIEIIDTSTETVGSLDPALNLVGVTVEYNQ